MILAVLLLGWPGPTVVVTVVFFGAYLLVSGIAQVLFAFSMHASGIGRVLLFISGAASLVLAVLAFAYSLHGYIRVELFFLQIWIAVCFILRGGATSVLAISEHRRDVSKHVGPGVLERDPELPGRGWIIAFGVVGLIAGILVLALPFVSLLGLLLVVGLCLVITGVLEIVSSFGIRKSAKTVEA